MMRRRLLAAAPAALALPGVAAAPAAANPDAALIALVAEHVANLRAYNDAPADEGTVDERLDPLWQAYVRTKRDLDASVPLTLAGAAALIAAVQAEDDGRFTDSIAGRWAWTAMHTVQRLAGQPTGEQHKGRRSALPVPASAASDPDAELHALCAEFHRHNAQGRGHAAGSQAWEAAMDARFDTYQQLEDMRPATAAGHRAKARVAIVLLAENHYDVECGDPDARFALATLRGLAEEARPSADDHSWTGKVLAGDPQAHRLLELARTLPPAEWDAFVRCGERMAAGMPAAEAQAIMLQECGRASAGEAA